MITHLSMWGIALWSMVGPKNFLSNEFLDGRIHYKVSWSVKALTMLTISSHNWFNFLLMKTMRIINMELWRYMKVDNIINRNEQINKLKNKLTNNTIINQVVLSHYKFCFVFFKQFAITWFSSQYIYFIPESYFHFPSTWFHVVVNITYKQNLPYHVWKDCSWSDTNRIRASANIAQQGTNPLANKWT